MKTYFNFFCLLCLLFCLSCEDIANNRRLIFTGNLIDENNQPIQNARLVSTLNADLSFASAQNKIGQGQTNANGFFEFTSLVPLSSNAGLQILPEESDAVTDEFADVALAFNNGVFDNVNQIELNDFEIPRKAILELNILKTSTEPVFLEWTIERKTAQCFISISDLNQLENIEFCDTFFSISGQNSPENPEESRTIESLRNSTVFFIYSINNAPNQVIEIPLNNPSNVFEFTY
ncbi:hypothetical protein [Mesohalobacter halotolerans]|uniref:Carboxypeptidase regulatory-like domain-containing protein n=1 Tax=Mesohalobacter halotolerans TaxID=1883405 RepID=A0A4V6AM99_9FLAO|nr:hypothetical protein [Mesohalobacter halotolerans]TKS56655.1 hypothetical protein FCN74_06390 [Mesohalobacter halotolerans]